MWGDEYHCDVCFEVEGERVQAHRVVLAYTEHTTYFKALLQTGTQEASADVIPMKGVSHAHFLAILQYIYTNELHITAQEAPLLLQAAAAAKYNASWASLSRHEVPQWFVDAKVRSIMSLQTLKRSKRVCFAVRDLLPLGTSAGPGVCRARWRALPQRALLDRPRAEECDLCWLPAFFS